MSHETFKAPELDHLAELLPAYDFEAFIAKGGMGAVYKATQRSLDRAVAVKVLPRELGEDPEFRKSFETEAKAMAKLNHPNLISVYDYGDIEGMPYIVMEHVEGKSLYHSAWNQVIEPDQAVTIIQGILAGLGHAHEHGIHHGDIKPANILLTSKAEPRIGDFGLARHSDAESDGHQVIMGTPGYAAPELTQAPEKVGKPADLFAVGVILHELLTGQRPDLNQDATPQPSGDARLDAIWRKACESDIPKRYDSAEEMSTALEKWKSLPRLSTGTSKASNTPVLKRQKALATASPATSASTPTTAHPQGTSSSAPASPPAVDLSTGSNWSLARNALIGAVLIAAVLIGVKVMRKSNTESDAAENTAKKEAFEKRMIAEAERKRAGRETGTGETPTPPPTAGTEHPATGNTADDPVEPPKPKKVETTLEGLERLKSDLAAGKRDEFPPGTKRRGDNDFLFIETPLSWYQALSFAEEHGGHLSVVKTPEELTWISELVGGDADIWLGAGRAGRNVWSVNDGTDWALDDAPRGVGPFASLNKIGTLRAGKIGEVKPFVIQWHRDGSNPATLETILKRTRDTLDTPNPIFPPGTGSNGARHLLTIPLPIKRKQAAELAMLGGGILAVPASRTEAAWLEDELENHDGSAGFWLGGQRKGGAWSWDTGEEWDHARWIDDQAPADGGDALVIVPNQGWTNAEPSQDAAGLVIEWSSDAP